MDDAGPGRIYQAFKEITGIVQASGRGRYTVADVQLGTGLHSDQSGGWAILVAYSDPGEPLRNLTVFDGLKFVVAEKPDEPVDIPLSGFLTPPAPAPVKTRVGLVAYEGDIGIVGDNALLNFGLPTQKRLENPANPPNNFFNSSISDPAGTILTDRDPADRNIFGFDGDFFESDQYLSNGQRATTLRLSTNGDGYAPGAVLFSTDLFAPKIEPVKSVDKAVAQVGDVLTYQVAVRNTGLDPATNVVFRDAIPANTDYVPNSLSIVAGANAGPKTDAPDDDAAEFVSGGVVFRLGELAVNGSATVQFKVRVHSLGLPLNLRILNSGTVGFTVEDPGRTGQGGNQRGLHPRHPARPGGQEDAHGRLRGWRVRNLRDRRQERGRGTDPGSDGRHRHAAARGHARRNGPLAATAGAVSPPRTASAASAPIRWRPALPSPPFVPACRSRRTRRAAGW